MKKLFLIFIIIFFMFAITGCQYMEQTVKDDQPVAEAKVAPKIANFQFEDLPVPNNLNIINDDSFLYETSNYRTGIMKYKGEDDFKNVGNFFKGELPKYNWNLVNSIEFKNVMQLIFAKPDWITVIYLEQNGNNVIVTITIGPKSETGSEIKSK